MSPTVERTVLAPGLEISRVLTGLWQVADMERDGAAVEVERAAGAMRPYVDAGFTTFDMADHYGSAEVICGRFNREHPGEAQFLTKWVPEPGAITRSDVEAAVDLAAERLATDRIDLLQFHAWAYAHPSWLDCIWWLDELRQEGRIGHLGLTNCDAPHLAMLCESGVPIVTNQVSHSLIDRRALGPLAQVCERYGVRLLGYGTLAGGFLSERWLDVPDPGLDESLTWSQLKYRRFIEVAGGWDRFQGMLSAAHQVALRVGVSLSNLATRYTLEHPQMAGVIVGARLGKSTHLQENLKLFSFELDAATKAELDEIGNQLDPIPGDCGDEYRRPPFLTASGDLSHHLTQHPAPFEVVEGSSRRRVLTGTVWEEIAGFSRAVRKGNRIWVSGTTATHGDRVVGGGDPGSQAEFILDKIEGSLQSVGGGLNDVVRTRIYVRNQDDWEAVSRVHGRRFGAVAPANTLVQAPPIGEEYLVEIEAEADVS